MLIYLKQSPITLQHQKLKSSKSKDRMFYQSLGCVEMSGNLVKLNLNWCRSFEMLDGWQYTKTSPIFDGCI